MEPIEEGDLNLQEKLTGERQENKKEKLSGFNPEKEVSEKKSSLEKDDSYSKILSKVQGLQGVNDDNSISVDAESAAAEKDAQSQVNRLVDVAMEKGVVHAVKVAKHMQDNYVLDAFHDKLLADEFHDALLKKGIIKDI